MNDVLIASIWAMGLAQWVKVPILYFKNKKWDWQIVVSTGSMPSSHSAFVVALATSVGLKEGFNSTLFALACVFALITVHDAIKVRGESGKQAKVINQMVVDLTSMYNVLNMRKVQLREEKLKELIGHTTNEVLAGIVFGIAVALIYFYFV